MEDAWLLGSVVLREFYSSQSYEKMPRCAQAADVDHGEVPLACDLLRNAEDEGLL